MNRIQLMSVTFTDFISVRILKSLIFDAIFTVTSYWYYIVASFDAINHLAGWHQCIMLLLLDEATIAAQLNAGCVSGSLGS